MPMRVLDLDLDFFLYRVDHHRDGADDRADGEFFPPWPLEEAIDFLVERCHLDGRRPGFVVEHHNEIFYRWGEAIEAGQMTTELEVVHVDAHADLGMGDASYAWMMGELAYAPIADRYTILKRRRPQSRKEMLALSSNAVTDGNWLMFALACGWLSSLTYVNNSSVEKADGARPNDLPRSVMQDFDVQADHLQVDATREAVMDWRGGRPTVIEHSDPPVPFATYVWREYGAAEPFDIVCLTRSPQYTPVEADPIFDAIRERFIDEEALS
jgi:hypothetical protein